MDSKKEFMFLVYMFVVLIMIFGVKFTGLSISSFLPEDKSFMKFECFNSKNTPYALPYTLNPYCDQMYGGYWTSLPEVHVKLNSEGFRDREFSLEKEGYRVVMLGDSWTFGYGVESEDTFSKVLEGMLDKNYEVMNLGVFGYYVGDYVNYLKLKGLKYSPDLVVVNLIRDDNINNSYKKKYQIDCINSLDDPDKLDEVECNINSIKSYTEYFDSLPLNDQLMEYSLPLFELKELAKEYGFDIMINCIDCPPKINEYGIGYDFYLELIDFLKDNGFVVLECDSRLDSTDTYIFEDDGHPNVGGHKIISDKIYNALIEYGFA